MALLARSRSRSGRDLAGLLSLHPSLPAAGAGERDGAIGNVGERPPTAETHLCKVLLRGAVIAQKLIARKTIYLLKITNKPNIKKKVFISAFVPLKPFAVIKTNATDGLNNWVFPEGSISCDTLRVLVLCFISAVPPHGTLAVGEAAQPEDF